MGSYVVVAIPSKEDRVWKVSSEKIPHLTMLYLDDSLANFNRVVEFVGHVCDTSLTQFGLSVDDRDTLGPKDADVLFFGSYGVKKLNEVRGYLLQDDDISVAYHKADQFPAWVPHLTLGYPESPAKKDDSEYPITWVNFDRIAIWNDDYAGPEFRLKPQVYSEMSMSDLDELSEQYALAHYGVLGMKWGKRKAAAEARAALPRHAGYSTMDQSIDRSKFGQKGVDRVNEHMLNGMDHASAVRAERSRRAKKKLLIVGAAYAASLLLTHGPGLAQGLANNYVAKKSAAAGAKAAANLLADSRGIGNHKIVDLGFNAATGMWS